MSVSILLADDHTILRQGLRALLEAEPGFTVVGEASTGVEALEKAELLRPDVIILDLMLPDIHGLEIIRQLSRSNSEIKIVVLSMYAKEAYVFEAFKSGASAYVLKGSDSSQLVEAIKQTLGGSRYLSPPLSQEGLANYILATHRQELDPYETLTNRERQILHLAACGYSNNEISQRLMISPRTVESHRAKLMSKLGLHNQLELLRYALQNGIIPLDECK